METMTPKFMHRLTRLIAEVRNRTGIDEAHAEALEELLKAELKEYYDELNEYYDELFTYAHDAGYDYGYTDGQDYGYSEGYASGYDDGYYAA